MMKEAHETYMKGILGYSEEPLVSMDYKGTTYSGIVDALSIQVIGNLAHVVSWYDNEWGYSLRVANEAFSDLSDFLRSFPVRVVTKPRRMMKEVKDLLDK